MNSRRFHLCIVCSGYWEEIKGGAEYQLYLLAQELLRRGHRVSYIFESTREKAGDGAGIELHPIRLPKLLRKVFYPSYYLAVRQIFKKLDRLQPDIVLNRVGNAWTGLLARYTRVRNAPYVWHVANLVDLLDAELPCDKYFLNRLIDRRLLQYGIRHCRNIVAQAEYQSDLLLNRFGRPASIVIPNFHPVPRRVSLERHGPFRVVWIGKYKQKKNPELFAGLAAVFAGELGYRFTMIGNASENGYQRQLASTIAAAGHVSQLGELPVESVNKILEEAHVLVNTSTFEGFPNTFIQAWMRGVPVASLHFDPDDVIKKHGIGFHSGSIETLARDIRALAGAPGAREAMGLKARQFAVETYGLENVVDRYEAYLSEMSGRCS